MAYNAAYAQHTLKISDKWTLNDGLRLNHVLLDAIFVDTSILHLPFTRARQANLAVTGNVGLVYASARNLKVAMLLSSGFRSPNVDDLTKVFDTRVGAVTVPNPDVKPEYSYNGEVNFNRSGRALSFGASVFYTLFRNALVVDRFLFNGQDSILYQGVKSAVFANQNKAQASIWGFSANGMVLIVDKTTVDGVVTYTHGRYKSIGTEVPLDHVPPLYGRLALNHKRDKWQAEAYVLFNGWKKIKDYSPSGEDNPQYATVDGIPSWMTVNAKLTAVLGKYLQGQLAIENILDRNYRYFASGISAPGRNFVVSLKAGL
jgi:hemoglobin/transferrin/lactoferrin receptor protein